MNAVHRKRQHVSLPLNRIAVIGASARTALKILAVFKIGSDS
jgi:hypothetical protein